MTTILLLEPNTLLAAAYVRALEIAGYTVRHTAGAQAAIHAADEQKPDIVVMEMQLGGRHNGMEFLHEFRSYTEWQGVPVVVNTVVYPPRMAAAAPVLRTQLGVVDILYKPTASLADLVAAVGRHAHAL